MTKESKCSRVGPITLQRFTQLPWTRWLERREGELTIASMGGVVRGCVRVWRVRPSEKNKWGRRKMRKSFDSDCQWYNDAIHSSERPQAAHWTDSQWAHRMDRNTTSHSSSALKDKTQEEEERKLHRLIPFGSNCWHRRFSTEGRTLLPPKQRLIVCNIRPTWIVFVYSRVAGIHQAQRTRGLLPAAGGVRDAMHRVLTHFDQWISRTLNHISMTKLKSQYKHENF